RPRLSLGRDTITAAGVKINPASLAGSERRAASGKKRPSSPARRSLPAARPKVATAERVKLQGLIFDIDGTLVDSNDHHVRCWIEAFEHFGKRFEYEVVRHQIGKGGDLLVPDLLNAREMRRFGEDVKKYRTDLYKRKYMMSVKPFPGVRDLFEQFRKRRIKLALASSSNPDEVEYYTQLLGVGDLLEGTTSKHDAEFSKPSPEIFRAALNRIAT